MASSPLVKLLMISGVFFSAAKMSAANDLFNPALLEIDRPVDVDISQFNRANSLPAGDYKVDIFVNGKRIEQRVVTFVQDNAEAEITPCFVDAKSVLASFGVKVEAVKALTEIDEK